MLGLLDKIEEAIRNFFIGLIGFVIGVGIGWALNSVQRGE